MEAVKINRRNLTLFSSITLFCVTSLITGFYLFFFPSEWVQVWGDFTIPDFEFSGKMEVEATARSFELWHEIDLQFRSEKSIIRSLDIRKYPPDGNSIFNASGDINLEMRAYKARIELLDKNTFMRMRQTSWYCDLKSDYRELYEPPCLAVKFSPRTKPAQIAISIPDGTYEVKLIAQSCEIEVSGTQTFSGDFNAIEILMNVTVHTRSDFEFTLTSREPQMTVEIRDFDNIIYNADNYLANLYMYYPKGTMGYDGKGLDLLGGADLHFDDFIGRIFLTSTTHPNIYSVTIFGSTRMIWQKYRLGAQEVSIPSKSLLDIIWIPGVGGAVLSYTLLWYKRPKYKTERQIVFVLITFLSGLTWAIYTEQPVWLQSLFSYVTLFITIIIYLRKSSKETETAQLSHES